MRTRELTGNGVAVGEASPAAAASLGYSQVVQGIGSVIAPATLLTGIAFYFGWARTVAFDEYFGLDPEVVGYSTRDYVLRSLDPLFLPVLTVLVIAIATVLVHGLVKRAHARGTRPRELERLQYGAAIVGGVLFAFGVLAMFGVLPFSTPYLVGSLFPAIGALLLAYAAGLHRRLRGEPPLSLTAHVLVGLLIALSLFWAAGLYAGTVGRSQARDLAAHLNSLPGVTLLSSSDLALPAVRGVVEHPGSGASSFVYGGLRLLTERDKALYLVPDKWRHTGGSPLLVVPETDSLRVALTPGVDRGVHGSALNGGGLVAAALAPITASPPPPARSVVLKRLGPLRVTTAAVQRNGEVDVENLSGRTVAGVVVDGALKRPAHAVVVAPHAACHLSTRRFVCRLDPLAPHHTASVTLTYTGAKTADGFLRTRYDGRTFRMPVGLEPT